MSFLAGLSGILLSFAIVGVLSTKEELKAGYKTNGSLENEALENEDRSTKHPKLENEAP